MQKKIGTNSVVFAGVVRGEPTIQETTGSRTPACSFPITSDREGERRFVSCTAKINGYNAALVEFTKNNIGKGVFIVVDGELMNREVKGLSSSNERPVIFTEIRAWNFAVIKPDGSFQSTIPESKMSQTFLAAIQDAVADVDSTQE